MKVVDNSETAHSENKIDIWGSIPFLSMHIICIGVFFTGVSATALAVCFAAIVVRMFGVTGGFHRYFSHKTFKTSRAFQFVLAFLGTASAQLGPLWWASHHRRHHRFTDQEEDIHSPSIQGFFWAHMGWIMCKKNFKEDRTKSIPDFAQFAELRFLDNYPYIPPMIFAGMIVVLGIWISGAFPNLHTSVYQIVMWGFFVSTVILYHLTFSINSLAHIVGVQRFKTKDTSRNNFVLALLTMGEGWHNNHHRYAGSERQGFYWWQIDMTHYILTLLSWLRIVWDIRKPPQQILIEGRGK
ncbi:acyl-CoA desaturase [bacterium]|nr:acyl-CoA desaturase [bacterium]MCP5463002.1 acyl-CoA desaturase [bacterium]